MTKRTFHLIRTIEHAKILLSFPCHFARKGNPPSVFCPAFDAALLEHAAWDGLRKKKGRVSIPPPKVLIVRLFTPFKKES